VFRVGVGWDRHRLEAGRPCVLGGVRFVDSPVGPLGHSDGDAVVHAVIDALLGATGLGDIGRHYPDTDPAWAGADSLGLLRDAAGKAAAAGWRVVNVDVTLIAERPRVAPRAADMAEAMAAPLGVTPGLVSVKGTRGEGLGPEGRGECVTAVAVALLTAAPDAGQGG